MPSLNETIIRDIPLVLPDLEEQREIATVLGALDDKIEQNRRTGRALEALARATFKAWFVDFEPVRAKADGAKGYPGTPPAAFAALPTRLTHSPLGPVPEGWEVRCIADILTLHYGRSLPKTARQNGQIPVYGSGGLDGTHNAALVAGPGIVIGRKGSVGTLYWADSNFIPIDTTYYVEPKSYLTLPYLYELLKTLGLQGMNTDAAVPGLNRENVYRLEITQPPQNIAEAFDEFIQPIRDMMRQLIEESVKLVELRDYLLPRLLSGRVRVGTA